MLPFLVYIFRPLIFNVFICDLFLFANSIGIASYADDYTLYANSSKRNWAIEKLKQSLDGLFTWFQNNGMKANAYKCHCNQVPKFFEIKLAPTRISLEWRSLNLILKVAPDKNN